MSSFFICIMAFIAFGCWTSSARRAGNNLPGHAELVFEPSACNLAAPVGELRPILVDLLLRVAANDKRDGLSELVVGDRR